MEEAYRKDGVFPILLAPDELEKINTFGSIPIATDLIEEEWAGKRKMHKLDSIRHDPRKVSAVLMSIYRGQIWPSESEG